MLLLGSAKDVMERFRSLNSSIVMSAEYTCAPDRGLALAYPATQPSPTPQPFTFVNSGSYIGFVGEVEAMLDEVLPGCVAETKLIGRFSVRCKRTFRDTIQSQVLTRFDWMTRDGSIDSTFATPRAKATQ